VEVGGAAPRRHVDGSAGGCFRVAAEDCDDFPTGGANRVGVHASDETGAHDAGADARVGPVGV
jgi:hypothetical protein